MNRLEKIAWLKLKIIGISLIVALLTACFVSMTKDVMLTFTVGGLVLSIGSLIALLIPHTILFRPKEHHKVVNDERDTMIQKKAHLVSYATLWCILIIACTVPFFIAGSQGSIPAVSLMHLLTISLVTVIVVESGTVVIQYHWGISDGGE